MLFLIFIYYNENKSLLLLSDVSDVQ